MQIPKNDLERIVRYGVKAPSGDNCQPWRFVLRGGELCVLFDPARDTSLYNVRDTASLIACGALIENMSLAAPSIGYRLKVDLFSKGIDNAVATIRFENAKRQTTPSSHSLRRGAQTDGHTGRPRCRPRPSASSTMRQGH